MVDMIVQNVSHKGEANLSFTIPRADLEQCLLLTRELLEEWPEAKLSFDESMAKLTVVGIGLRTHTGVGEKMFRALADAKINVQMINTSEIRMSAVIDVEQGKKAHESLCCTVSCHGSGGAAGPVPVTAIPGRTAPVVSADDRPAVAPHSRLTSDVLPLGSRAPPRLG